MNQKQIKLGGFYRVKQDTGQREKIMLCGEVIGLDGNRQMNGRPAAAWVRVQLWEKHYGPGWGDRTKPTGGERWVTPHSIVEPWNEYALCVDQEERRRTMDAELAARQSDDLTRRLAALGIVVSPGLDRPPYLLSHEALCTLLQQAEKRVESATMTEVVIERDELRTERDALRNKLACQEREERAAYEVIKTNAERVVAERDKLRVLLSQASAERIRLQRLLSALFRCPPNQQASELPMWAVIKGLLHVGKTRAHELCQEFGHDPDEEVAGLVVNGLCSVCDVMFCERCEELTHVPEGHKPECEHCEPKESSGAEVAAELAEQEELHAAASRRLETNAKEVTTLKRHPVKIGEWVRAGCGTFGCVLSVYGDLYEVQCGERFPQFWRFSSCEPCDKPGPERVIGRLREIAQIPERRDCDECDFSTTSWLEGRRALAVEVIAFLDGLGELPCLHPAECGHKKRHAPEASSCGGLPPVLDGHGPEREHCKREEDAGGAS